MVENKAVKNDYISQINIYNAFLEYRLSIEDINSDVRKKALDIIYIYINQYYKERAIKTVGRALFEQFYSVFLPMHIPRSYLYQVDVLSKEWALFCKYIQEHYEIKGFLKQAKEAYEHHKNEIQRIKYAILEIRKYGEVPVLCWEPVIVDMICYKNMKSKQKAAYKYFVYDQGYYIVKEIISSFVLLQKEKSVTAYYKIKVDQELASEIKKGDIIHMSIKRKMFCTSWDIVSVKAYFNKNAMTYLNLGGSKNEDR